MTNDPRWISARFASKCGCGTTIMKGSRIFYYPRTKQALCERCGEEASAQFEAMRADEEFFNG